MRRGGRPTLRQGLDKDVSAAELSRGPCGCIYSLTHPSQIYQIVRKIIDDNAENDQFRLSVSGIYDTIKRSNSSLNRKPKRILEDSIERVVGVLGEDEDDSIDGDFEGLEEQPAPPVWNMRSASRDAHLESGLYLAGNRTVLTGAGVQQP